MQNKGAFRFLAILIALACVFQLSFTVCTRLIEKDAKNYASQANIDPLVKKLSIGKPGKEDFLTDSIKTSLETHYLDSMSQETVYNLLIRKYTYKECKEREINLGLDLKGGMNVTMEVSVPDIIQALAQNTKDPLFVKVLEDAKKAHENSSKDFVALFGESFKNLNKSNAKLASFFIIGLKDKITFNLGLKLNILIMSPV